MRLAGRDRTRFFVLMSIVGALGVASAVWILANQRLPNPLRDTYVLHAKLTEAGGVVAGIGQPVNVAGVRVGSVVGADHDADGNAVLSLEINRDELPRVRADARVALEPVTPLKDMQIALDPGTAAAPPLREGATVGVRSTAAPVPLDTLLGALDADTRAFMTSLLASVAEGTRDRAPDLRKALRAFGPTTAQVGAITRELEHRRAAIARLVHNLGEVTLAAADDEQLTDLVRSGEATLRAVAEQEEPLRDAITRLPGTLDQARTTLRRTAQFSEALRPALDALDPATRRLPAALRELRPFTQVTAVALREQLRPLVREADATVRPLARATSQLSAAMPGLFDATQALTYFLNVLAHNPKGHDEGGLFWVAWMMHNFNSTFSLGEAHGGAGRASVLLSCKQVTNTLDVGQVLKLLTGSTNLCPEG